MSYTDPLESMYATHHAETARYGFGYRARQRGPQFAAWVGTDRRVLDLRCRDGTLTQHYASGNLVTGVDIDQQALELASQKLRIATLRLDLNREQLPFDSASFEVVVGGEVLEHLINSALVVREAHRVLMPAGVFIGSVPNGFHWRPRLAFLKGQLIEDATHLHAFSQSELLRLLQAFKDVALVPIGGIGGHVLRIVPTGISQPLVRHLPALLANGFLFRASKQ